LREICPRKKRNPKSGANIGAITGILLTPLNKIASKTGKLNWKWGDEQQKAFEKAKDMLSKKARLSYPDFSKPFDLYTDASDLQLGATLVQEGKPLGFYTRKLNSAQMNYTVGKKELLGIVEGLKAFDGGVRGMKVTVHTDHLNLLYQNMPSQRMVNAIPKDGPMETDVGRIQSNY
jgi:hypothetical protein